MNGYQGWKNYETWVYALWLDNEEPSYRAAVEAARECREAAPDHGNVPDIWSAEQAAKFTLADRLKDDAETAMPDLGASPWSDLLNAAFSEIDWHEIAEHYLGALAETP